MAVSAITIFLGFGRSVLLMRLLSPEQFGIVALALFFMTLLTPFSAFGVDFALIQSKEVRKETLSTHFALRLGLALGVLALGCLAAPFLRRIYADQAAVVDVFLALLSLNVLSASFSTPGTILRREMRFGTIALLNLAASLAMTITAPLLAYFGAGLWSLVAEQAAGPLIRWIALWGLIRPWRLSLRFDTGEARSFLRFGRQVFSANILGILLDRFDDFWTGSALGPAALGYYSRAYEMAQYPERVLATPITHVFFSTYAALQENREELSKAFFRSSSFLVRVGLLMAVVLLVTAPEVVLILFGEVWLPIVPVFRLMLVYIMLDPLYVNLSYLIIGVGRPDWLTRVRLAQVGLFAVTVITFARLWNINGVAIAANLMMLSGTLVLLVFSRRFVSFSLSRMILWPGIATTASIATGYVVIQAGQWASLGWMFVLKTVCTAGVYALILYLTERQIIFEHGSQILGPLWNQVRARMT
ncbi:MAG: oligosaccharide flippase family protein [Anaerolineae bacterium]